MKLLLLGHVVYRVAGQRFNVPDGFGNAFRGFCGQDKPHVQFVFPAVLWATSAKLFTCSVTRSKSCSGMRMAARVRPPPISPAWNMGPKRVRVRLASRAFRVSSNACSLMPSSSATSRYGLGVSGRPYCRRLMMAFSVSVKAGATSGDSRRAAGSAVTDIASSPLQIGFVAEQNRVGNLLKVIAGNHLVELAQYPLPVNAVNHAEQVVGPVGQSAGALVAQGYKGYGSECAAKFTHLLIGHIPYHHGVGPVTQGAVLHDQAGALDQPLILPVADGAHHLLFAQAGLFGQRQVRAGC